MTDDYKVIDEMENFRENNQMEFKMWTICKKHRQGFPLADDLRNKVAYSEEEVTDLLTEVEIAKRAKWFVGTETSNVFRYINMTSDNFANHFSLDKFPYHPFPIRMLRFSRRSIRRIRRIVQHFNSTRPRFFS